MSVELAIHSDDLVTHLVLDFSGSSGTDRYEELSADECRLYLYEPAYLGADMRDWLIRAVYECVRWLPRLRCMTLIFADDCDDLEVNLGYRYFEIIRWTQSQAGR